MMMPQPDFDLFLSHNNFDKAEVVNLKRVLATRELKCWLDQDELRPGQKWIRLLENGLENSRAIAACFGSSGVRPWHDEEMQSALQIAVSEGRSVIPVLLPGAGEEPELPIFLKTRVWVDFRQGFTSDAIDRLVWGITGIRPGHAEPPQSPPPPVSEKAMAQSEIKDPELLRKLREVFGSQYERLKAILESNQPLRESMVRRFKIKGNTQSLVTAELMFCIHCEFLPAIGEFAEIYRESSNKDAVIELVSSVLFLAMCPDYAAELMDDKRSNDIVIASAARQGIAEILISWTHGKKIVPIKTLSQEKSMGTFETTPQMGLSEIKLMVMEKLGINPEASDADAQLEDRIRLQRDFKEPVHVTISDQTVVSALRAPGSPLRNLLLFIKLQGQTINPRGGERYDSNVKAYLAKLSQVFNQS